MRDAFASEIIRLIQEDDKILLLTGDLGFGVFDEIQKKYPKNFINIGVAEQNMSGIAAGLAIEGYKVFTYSIANFSTFRCLEQIRNDIAYHDLNVTIVSVGGGFSYGSLGMSHHATEDISIMRSMPGMKVCVPATKSEAISATRHLAFSDGPGYLRIDKSDFCNDEYEEPQYNFGQSSLIKEGKDITIICSGGILEEAVLASEELSIEGISCRVLSMHTIKPIDKEAIIRAVSDTRGIVSLEEHTVVGGLGSAISEVCMEHSLYPEFFLSLGLKDTFSQVVGDQQYLRNYYQMDSDFIIRNILKMFKDG